jgi:DNA polymerase-3 subunit delta
MSASLVSLLKLSYDNIPPILCLNANLNNKSILQYITNILKKKFNNCNIHHYIIDKIFDYQQIKQLLSIDSLFDESFYIELQYKTKPNKQDINEIHNIIPLIQNNHKIIIHSETINYKDIKNNYLSNPSQKIPTYLIQEQDINIIIPDIFQSNQINITPDALQLIYSYNQNNPTSIIQEAKRLNFYFKQKDIINKENIINIIQEDNQYTIYNLSNHYLNGDLEKSLKVLTNLINNNDNLLLINWLFAEDLRKLIKLKQAIKDGKNLKQVIKELSIWGDSEKYILIAVNRIPYKNLIILLNEISLLDLSIKGILNNDISQKITNIIKLFCS